MCRLRRLGVFSSVLLVALTQGFCGIPHYTLEEAYAELGFDPRVPGNAVVVYFSDPHMNSDPDGSPAPGTTTELDPRMIDIINSMQPPPAKIIVAGDVSSSFAVMPGADATHDPPTYKWATNEMHNFAQSIARITNIAPADVTWIPGNHDQGAGETNAETFRLMFPNMPPYQVFDVAGVRFFLVNSGNYGQPGEAQSEWLRAEVAKTPVTKPVAVVTHQPPFVGVAVHRGMPLLLREVFGQWPERWWVFDGHQHAHGMEVYDVGKKNVAQFTIGPSTTNTFVGYTFDCGFSFVCISNGIVGYVYHHYMDGSYRVGIPPNWEWPKHFSAAFEDVQDTLLWRRLKSRAKAPELLKVTALNSIDWWAYCTELVWELPLARHGNNATHLVLMIEGLSPIAIVECSTSQEQWTPVAAEGATNRAYFYPLPKEVAQSETAYARFRGFGGNNWVGGWGLATTNPGPKIVFPKIQPIPTQQATQGVTLVVSNSAVNPYSPPEIHRFKLVQGPEGSWIDETTGIFYWRPPVGVATNFATAVVRVEDTGTPPMGTAAEFGLEVLPALAPVATYFSQQEFSINATVGSAEYQVLRSDDGRQWSILFATNFPASNLSHQVRRDTAPASYYRITRNVTDPYIAAVDGVPGVGTRLSVAVPAGEAMMESSTDLSTWSSEGLPRTEPLSFEVLDARGTTTSTGPATRYKVIRTR